MQQSPCAADRSFQTPRSSLANRSQVCSLTPSLHLARTACQRRQRVQHAATGRLRPDGVHAQPQAIDRARIARKFFDVVVEQAKAAGLMSKDHFAVDGTLIEANASLKS